MDIRGFQAGDEPALHEAFYLAIHQTAAAHYSPEQLDAWAPTAYDPEAWAERMRAIRPFIAVDRDVIIGYADLQDDGYIDHFFVLPAMGRRGVGSVLMRHIHDQALQRGITRLYSDVSLTARPFFERWNFGVERAQSVSVRGAVLENFRMVKQLPATQPG